MSGQELYEAKLATGRYDHYDEAALAILRQDCERQMALSEIYNGRRDEE